MNFKNKSVLFSAISFVTVGVVSIVLSIAATALAAHVDSSGYYECSADVASAELQEDDDSLAPATTTVASTTSSTTTTTMTTTTTTTMTSTTTTTTTTCWHASFVKDGYEVADYCGTYYTEADVICIAKTLAIEDGDGARERQAAVCWTILNRCDYDQTTDICGVCAAPSQFAYSSGTVYRADHYEMARDVLNRWAAEKEGLESYRVLPAEYRFFWGDGYLNYFRITNCDYNYWDFSLESPYM